VSPSGYGCCQHAARDVTGIDRVAPSFDQILDQDDGHAFGEIARLANEALLHGVNPAVAQDAGEREVVRHGGVALLRGSSAVRWRTLVMQRAEARLRATASDATHRGVINKRHRCTLKYADGYLTDI
jgi:hypothetical protein